VLGATQHAGNRLARIRSQIVRASSLSFFFFDAPMAFILAGCPISSLAANGLVRRHFVYPKDSTAFGRPSHARKKPRNMRTFAAKKPGPPTAAAAPRRSR
jgi:hypothetical protein